ncbi:phosphoadenylyl-sulfate reductase [Corynebacterium epidermidicanis]|uniref:Adenosine 5'-phosphosulfate reductase n=1 Tax=Corynebacterium epidermidicanis TaxID=1050174 RepID=A0A0G3GRL1_9CORY|nr:phosphoadenylyl-sulfate reductase [Corynebacterium epidermidicanis]AKK03759.1 thioredoxin-dependent phosophoadenylyl-sulfate reductase [Corynebacterium epidermidicanis]
MLLFENKNYRDPNISPAGPEPASLSEDIKQRNAELVAQYQASLSGASAQDILAWAAEHAGPTAITLSMENTVLAELGARYFPAADFLFLDTGYHFEDTLLVANAVELRYPDQKLVRATPVLTRAEQDDTYGPNLYQRNPEACCRMRKVEPLQRTLGNYQAWVTGIRRADGPTRAHAPAIELDKAGRLKISPLVTWSLEETERFAEENELIYHPLTKQGYPSIGCATCTLPVAPGQDPRSGRWAGTNKTECGLHT